MTWLIMSLLIAKCWTSNLCWMSTTPSPQTLMTVLYAHTRVEFLHKSLIYIAWRIFQVHQTVLVVPAGNEWSVQWLCRTPSGHLHHVKFLGDYGATSHHSWRMFGPPTKTEQTSWYLAQIGAQWTKMHLLRWQFWAGVWKRPKSETLSRLPVLSG